MNSCLLLNQRKTPLNAQHTKKLFWGKYIYKVVLRIPKISVLRYGNLRQSFLTTLFNSETLEEWMAKGKMSYYYPQDENIRAKKLLWNHRFELHKFVSLITKYKSEKVDIKFRFEGNTVSLCFNDQQVYDELIKSLSNVLDLISWPKNEHHRKFLVANPLTEIVNEYPYGVYTHKINLRGYKPLDKSTKENFADWIKNYPDFKVTDASLKQIKKGFIGNGKFIYSTNTKDVLLLQMFLGDNIKDITTYKLEREIDANTNN